MTNINNQKTLTLSQMLCEPYSSVKIHQLLNQFDLAIDESSLGPFLHYTPQQLLTHYHTEIELAHRLLQASKQERKRLYTNLYDELFRKIPYHPQLTIKANPEKANLQTNRIVTYLKSYLRPNTVFLELGPGDCRLSFEVAKMVGKVYAIDVSSEVTQYANIPDNFNLIISDGSSVNVPPKSVDVAYSNQLMEHLHPEDAIDQLKAIYNSLTPGGIYICTTPHRFGGPADVSRFFDETSKGFHLKEYTNCELKNLFVNAGFSKVYSSRRFANRLINISIWPAIIVESIIQPLPHKLRRIMYRLLAKLLSLRLIAKA